jgi:uncharacterized protein YrrD
MQIGAEVFTVDQEKVGNVDRVVLDPKDKQVTHFVVERGFLLTEDKVVPADWVDIAKKEKLILNQPQEKFSDLPNFEETHYVTLEPDDVEHGENAIYFYPPMGITGQPRYYRMPPVVPKTKQNLPDDVVAISDGAKVFDSKGEQVGTVERVLFDSELNRATHFLIAKGLFFKERKLIPTFWLTEISEDKAHLSLSAETLTHLPDYETE